MQIPCYILVVNLIKNHPSYYHTVEEILHQLVDGLLVYPSPIIYSVS
jgi:hypothetical protein